MIQTCKVLRKNKMHCFSVSLWLGTEGGRLGFFHRWTRACDHDPWSLFFQGNLDLASGAQMATQWHGRTIEVLQTCFNHPCPFQTSWSFWETCFNCSTILCVISFSSGLCFLFNTLTWCWDACRHEYEKQKAELKRMDLEKRELKASWPAKCSVGSNKWS